MDLSPFSGESENRKNDKNPTSQSEKWGFEFMPWLPLGLDYQVIDSKSEYQKFSFNVKRFG
jgi:hypothetical protein